MGPGTRFDATGLEENPKAEPKRPSSSAREGDRGNRRTTMPKEFENANEAKVAEETISNPTPDEMIEHVAGKAAVKAAKTEQKYDKENSSLFTK
jgi:hypothetical protein